MGLRSSRRQWHGHGPRSPPAGDDRGGPVAPLHHRDGVGRRIPVQVVIEVALVLGLLTLVAGVAAALGLRLLPSLRLQLAALAVLAVLLPLGVVLASGWVMFHMHDDVKILTVSVA